MRAGTFTLLVLFGLTSGALGVAFLRRRREAHDLLGGLACLAAGIGMAATGLVFLVG